MKNIFIMVAFLVGGTFGASALELKRDGKIINVPVCGGFINIQCKKSEWCDFQVASACGIGDQFGTCRPRPEICIKIYMPVCGCDGNTYGNSCEAAAVGYDVAYPGTCRPKPKG